MNRFFKLFFAGVTGVAAFGAAAAFASNAPGYQAIDHDRGSHAATHYNDYPADQYYRAGPYRDQGVRLSVSVGDGYYDRRGRYDRGLRNGYRGRAGRVINREVFDTRFRARIVLVEEAVRTRRGPRLVCTVQARGPEARYVSGRRMHRIARNYCSPRARVRVFA
ncbi:MAG: hypothetical protein AAFX54_13350 [Pseudomonadota bacterium]